MQTDSSLGDIIPIAIQLLAPLPMSVIDFLPKHLPTGSSIPAIHYFAAAQIASTMDKI